MNEDNHILPAGTVLHGPLRNYRIEGVIGAGGFGITYRVSAYVPVGNVQVRTQLAVKEFFMKDSCWRGNTSEMLYSQPSRGMVEDCRRDFLAEARRLQGLCSSTPMIVNVNEVFEANNTVYYVMELIEGGNLRALVKERGALPEADAIATLMPLLEAVAILHANRVTHLDIKPDNIMFRTIDIDNSRRPVLIDFGLAKHYDKSGHPTSTLRSSGVSAGYAPIEQYVGISTFSPEADVYALAATLLFMLTGRDPEIATELTPEKIAASLPHDVSDATCRAIMKAMSMNKTQRTPSVEAFIADLENSPCASLPSVPSTALAHDVTPASISQPLPSAATQVAATAPVHDSRPMTSTPPPAPPVTPAPSAHPRRNVWKTVMTIAVSVVATLILAFVALMIIGSSADDEPRPCEVTDVAYPDSGVTSYTGHVNADDVPDGYGEAVYSTGTVYRGPWVEGLPHGENASVDYADGDSFTGTFQNGEMYAGRMTSGQDKTKGMYFEGTFKNNEPYNGTWYNPDGTKCFTLIDGVESSTAVVSSFIDALLSD